MRTTITIDDDILDQARNLANTMHVSFRSVVNQALRAGLEHSKKSARQQEYKTTPHTMGVRRGYNLDNIQELLAQSEGEDFR